MGHIISVYIENNRFAEIKKIEDKFIIFCYLDEKEIKRIVCHDKQTAENLAEDYVREFE